MKGGKSEMYMPGDEALCDMTAGPVEFTQAVEREMDAEVLTQPGPPEIALNTGFSTRREAERARFAEWLALTGPERIERGLATTQRQLAAELGICESTISAWKSDPRLQREVTRLLRARCQRHAPAIIDKMNEKALAGEGDVPAARTVLEHAMPDERPGVVVPIQVNVSTAELVGGADAEAVLPEWYKKQQRQQGAAEEFPERERCEQEPGEGTAPDS